MCFTPKVPKESAASISARKREAERVRTETAKLKRDALGQEKIGIASLARGSLLSGTGAGFGSNFNPSGRNYFG